MNAKRLLTLANVLDSVPDEQFDINLFWEGKPHDCGFVGCALGWATTIPEFAKAGFGRDEGLGYPIFGGQTSISAGASFFGLDYDDAYLMFMPVGYRELYRPATAKDVADKIRRFLKVRR